MASRTIAIAVLNVKEARFTTRNPYEEITKVTRQRSTVVTHGSEL